jgi:Tfp pilus assembly protein PilF
MIRLPQKRSRKPRRLEMRWQVMWLRYCTLGCVLLFSVAARAQRVPSTSIAPQLNGQVRYADGGRAAEFVLVRLESFGGGVVAETETDRNGKFHFTGLSPELYNVSVRASGYREAQQQVDLRTQLTDYVQLQLARDSSVSTASTTSKSPGVVDANIPNSAVAEFEKGSAALLKDHNLAEGIAHLEKAVAIYPKYSAAVLLLGTAYMDDRRWNEAEAALLKVVAIEPRATAAYLALGELYLHQKNYGESKKELLSAIGLDSKSARGHLTLGRLYYELGDLAKAGPEVGTALRIDPVLAPGHLLAGNILLRAHQPENAVIEFEEYLRLDPNGPFAAQAKEAVHRIKQGLAKR